MKKRTLVCFLIFLLCVFHSSIPGTVFGQDDDPSLAQQVFDKYSETLNREDIKAVLPAVLEGLKDPAIQRLLSAATIGLVVDSPDLLVTFVPTIDPEFVQLLKEDQALKDLLSDPLVHSLLQDSAAIDELAGLLGVGGTPPVDPTPPDPAPPTISITTPRPTTARQGSFNVAFATTDANGDPVTVTASISVDPAEAAGYYSSTIIGNSARVTQTAPTTAKPTIPGATVTLTLTANDGTADSTPATIVLTFGAAELPPETPPEPPEKPEPPTGDELPPVDLTTSNLNGTSQVGGLSLNRVHGRAFIRDLIVAASNGLIDATSADDQVERVVDFILAQVPQGFLPKRQIKQMLTANNPSSIFAEEKGSQLDFENFGNAIAPDLTEIIYTNVDNTTKFLASDNLNVYVRVADTLLGGNVEVRINGVEKVDATRITPLVFQQDTIPYTFRLEETLAATNLPALPDADFGGNKIFSGVVLRYSQTGKDGEYISVDMDPVHGERGVVWESEIGIPPPKEARDLAANVYYYFEVTLSEPVTLEIINPEALGAAVNSVDGTHTLEATRTYEINSWAMPDPRNIQLDDRGILEALFTPDVAAKLAPIALSAIGSVNSGDVRIPGNQIRQLQTALLNSANDLFTRFESTFDPMLVSVFSLPYVDIATESLWYANIDSIADGPVNFEALVINANDDVVDHIVADITADDSAPEADINIGTTEHATGYWNRDGVFVSTANPEATPALVNITSTVTKGIVGDGKGYLVYQIIKLDEHGRPLTTWLPLTVVNSMVASDLWDLVIENLPDDLTEFAVPGTDTTLNISQFPLDFILSALQGDVPIPGVEIDTIIIDAIESFVGIRISEDQYALLADLLGAVVDDINLFPITSDPSRMMTIPIQGENMPLMLGDYGIRAMGIDTLFNVGSHVAPTRLRVVVPEWDRTSVTMASLGDLNGDGDADEPYETGTIYSNATDVTLTIMVDERTVHPGTVMVQYLDADGTWQTIGELDLAEAGVPAGTALTLPWNVTDFDDLVMAGDSVELRTVTTNGLKLTDESETFNINLDADVHPVDPKVLNVDVDESSIVMTNPDSGAPQGTIQLIAHTPRRTIPATDSVLLEVKRINDEEWTAIGTAEMGDANGMSGIDTAAIMFNGKTLGEIYPSDTSMIHIDTTSSYLMWTIPVDTTMLEDSITVDNPGARDVSMDDNRYMVRATPVVDGALPDNPNENPTAEGEEYTEMFSVDNDDDVAPLGPTNIVATSIDAIDPVFMDNGDGTYTVGGLVDKYDPEINSPTVTITITPTAVRNTYHSVKLLTTLPEGAIIGDITETAEGSGVFTVTIDVGTLMNADEFVHNDRYLEDAYIDNPSEFIYNPKGDVYTFQLHALAYDKAEAYDDVTAADEMFMEYGNVQADDYEGDEITVNVQNTYRNDPGVIAITVENSDGMVNPDSGAPQGELTFNVYTYYITSPPTEGIRVEVKRPIDDTYERITGTAVDPVEVDVSDVPGIADLDDITGGLIGITQAGTESGGESVVAIPGRFMKWQFIVDTRELALEDTVTAEGTIKLDDTISRGDASERDVAVDENQYEVRAISLTPKNLDHPEYPQRDGVEASFSLDNVDDVPPLGPTDITDVSDHIGSLVANEDGSFTARGIVDDAVESTKLTFSIEPTAKPITYAGGKIRLDQTGPDGTVEELPPVDVSEGQITVDIGNLDNGTYMYYALVADEFGNWQVQGEDDKPSPVVTVHVLNFRVSDISDLTVTAVDGESPDRHILQETIGELQGRFPLKESIAVSFNVNNGSIAVEDLTDVVIGGQPRDGDDYTAGSDAANSFSLMANNLSEVTDGWYTPHGRVTIRDRFVDFPLATINLDNTGPMIIIETPTEGATVNDLSTLLAGFGDGDLGSGVSDGSGVSAENTAVVSLDRLRPEEVVQDPVSIDVDQNMVEQDLDSVVYTRIDKLAGGAYQFTAQVSDILGNVGMATVSFAVEGEDPTVVITAPASGQAFDASPASVTGFFAGGGEVNITSFTVNDEDVSESVTVDENKFTYMPADGFGEDSHTVSVEVTDGSGLTAKTALTFIVEYPVPTATITTPTAGQVYNHGSPIITGTFSGADPVIGTLSIDGEGVMVVSGNDFTYKPTEALSDGEHTVTLAVTDVNGNTAETMTEFTINISGPSVSIHSPATGQMYDHGMPSIRVEASADDEAQPVTVSVMVNGEAATMNEDGTYSPATELGDGEHTVVATATDANGKTAEAIVIFSIRLPVPTASITTPAASQVYDHGMPVITGEVSGATPIAGVLSVDGIEVMKVTDTEFSYTPTDALSDGDHTVMVAITDANGRTAQASTSFTVNIPGPSVTLHSPAAGQMYSHDEPAITWESSGVAEPVSTSLTINGEEVELADGADSYTPEEGLGEGEHTAVVTVTDANGKIAEATAVFSVEFPEASVSIASPEAGDTYDHTYNHISGEFSGVGEVTVNLMVDGTAVDTMVDDNQFTHTLAEKLTEGEHTVSVSVTDENGETAEASTTFSVVYPDASVSISSPVAGDIYDHTYNHISGEFSGVGEVTVTLMVDGTAVDAMVEGTQFTHTLAEKLAEGEHTVSVSVMDENGETAEASTTFSVVYPDASVSISSPEPGDTYDHTYNHISGEFSGVGEVTVSLMIDGTAVDAMVDDNQFTHTLAEKLTEGEHTVSVSVMDENGETAEASTTFSVVYPDASVSISSPEPGDTYDHIYNHISGEFSGVGEVTVTLMVDDTAVDAMVEGTQFTHALAEKLTEGEHTVSVSVMDENGETAEASTTFSVVYPDASVSISSPVAGDTYDHTYNHISGEFSGVGEVTVTLMVDGTAVDAVVDDNQFTHTLAEKLTEGEHTVSVSVMDENGETAEASTTFSVVYPEASVSISSPVAGDAYDHTYNHISGEFTGVGEVAVSLMLDGAAVEASIEGSQFSATLSDKLSEGEHKVSVEITDANGETAQSSAVFTVEYPTATVSISSPGAGDTYDHTFNHISGEFTGVGEVAVSLMLDGAAVEASIAGSQYSATLSDKLSEGEHTVSVEITDANGETAQSSAVFTVEYPMASVTLLSPSAGHTYTNGTPVISGEFTGVGEVNVTLTVDGEDTNVTVDGNQFAGELDSALGHGSHTVAVEVTDANGESAMTSAEFMVDLPAPSVTILSPAPAQTYGNGEAVVIRVEYAGIDASVTSFTINGDDVEVEPEDNMFMHTPEGLTTGEYIVNVEVTDAANNKTAMDTVVFNVKLDATPPVISEVAPSGTLKDTWVNISVVVSDEQSDIIGVDFFIRNEDDTHKGFLPLGTVIAGAQSSATTQQIADGNVLTQGSFDPGTHTLQVVATSEGGSSSHAWSFTVVTDNIKPTITSITPSGTQHAGLPTISASAHDESGVAEIVITVMDNSGEVVAGNMQNDDEDGSVGITRADFMPEMPLDEGTYVIEVRATDTFGNSSSAKGNFTIDFDTAAPLITSSSPQNGARLMYEHDAEKRPTVSITFGDAETGVNVESIRFIFNDQLINLTDDQKSATQVIYMPPADLEPGQYTVKIEVSDNAQIQGNVSDEAEGARDANTAVYEFSFFVEHGEVPILKAAPFNYPNPFKDNTRISFVLARRSNVSITIYDVTSRPVRVLVDNEVMEAGYYTRSADGSGSNAIGWDGKSSNGEDLARGIYFCQIMVTDGVEPEYATLKLALTR